METCAHKPQKAKWTRLDYRVRLRQFGHLARNRERMRKIE